MNTDNNFLPAYQKLHLKECKTPQALLENKRKCAALLYSASCSSSNVNTKFLLEKNLSECSNLMNNINEVNDAKIRAKLATKKNVPQFKSNLENIDFKTLAKPLSCDECEKYSKNVLQHFNSCYQFTKPTEKAPTTKKEEAPNNFCSFKTAADLYSEMCNKNVKSDRNQPSKPTAKRKIHTKFVPPMLNKKNDEELTSDPAQKDADPVNEKLKNIDPRMVELIQSEIIDHDTAIHWDDVAGLEFAKTAIQEAVIWPLLRPDIFKGIRRPPKGILLFGPPGTGKTLIGKCVASQSKSTFFSISASSLTSKWVGDGEKMVRALFAVARVHQPAVIFIDEIDSLLSQRTKSEHDSNRKIVTEFLVQLDGATTDSEERLLVIGATNRPQELDEAARRRFVKRLYIPLPENSARLQLVKKLIVNEKHSLLDEDFDEIAKLSDGYSGADLRTLCSEASLGPIRSIDKSLIENISVTDVRPLQMSDFRTAFKHVGASVCSEDLDHYVNWDKTYGSTKRF